MKTNSRWAFWKTALALSLPIALQNLLTSCGSLIDSLMIVSLGNDAATAAIGTASRWIFLLNVICFGFASGSATLISQYWGAKDDRSIQRSFATVLTIALPFALLYFVFLLFFPHLAMRVFTSDPELIALGAPYLRIMSAAVPLIVLSQLIGAALRATGRVFAPLFSSVLSVVVNTSLNYVFIFGSFGAPRLELRGAALATVIGFLVQTVVLLCFLLFSKNECRFPLRLFFSPNRSFFVHYLRVAFPVLCNETLWAIGTNVYVMVLARQGTEQYAGYTIYETVQQLFFVFFVGVTSACAIMVGKEVGAGRKEEGYRQARRFLLLVFALGAVLGLLLILVRDPILYLFPFETDLARNTCSNLLLFYGLWLCVRMFQYTAICGVFRAGGDTQTGCFMDLLSVYLFGIPTVCILGLLVHARFEVIVIGMFFAEDIIKLILCLRHFYSRKWIKQLTKQSPFSRKEEET